MLHRERLQVRDREVGNFSDVFLHHSWLPLDKSKSFGCMYPAYGLVNNWIPVLWNWLSLNQNWENNPLPIKYLI